MGFESVYYVLVLCRVVSEIGFLISLQLLLLSLFLNLINVV